MLRRKKGLIYCHYLLLNPSFSTKSIFKYNPLDLSHLSSNPLVILVTIEVMDIVYVTSSGSEVKEAMIKLAC